MRNTLFPLLALSIALLFQPSIANAIDYYTEIESDPSKSGSLQDQAQSFTKSGTGAISKWEMGIKGMLKNVDEPDIDVYKILVTDFTKLEISVNSGGSTSVLFVFDENGKGQKAMWEDDAQNTITLGANGIYYVAVTSNRWDPQTAQGEDIWPAINNTQTAATETDAFSKWDTNGMQGFSNQDYTLLFTEGASLDPVATPEPATMLLMLVGASAAAVRNRTRRKGNGRSNSTADTSLA